MNTINQQRILSSQQQALQPTSVELDGRDLADRLNFLSQFSTLINFYDNKNQLKDNWSHILLKDPLILLASIAKTDSNGIQKLFDSSALELNRLEQKKKTEDRLGLQLNQVFNQLSDIFLTIDSWTVFMKKYHHKYPLKGYLLKQIKEKYGLYLWSLLEFRSFLYARKMIKGLEQVKFYLFEDFDPKVWKENAYKQPFWEVLGISIPKSTSKKDEKDQLEELLTKDKSLITNNLSVFGKEIVQFLKTVVQDATVEFSSYKNSKSHFPDTLLVRSFAELLSIYKKELNKLTDKHLKFYYHSILKQRKQLAIEDKVFVAVQLAPKTTQLFLPEGTLFDAGLNAKKQSVFFKTTSSTYLYPSTIKNAYTLSTQAINSSQNGVKWQNLYKTNIGNPTTVKKGEKGELLHWNTFGDENVGEKQSMGLAIASPMFYLNEGARTIDIVAELSKEAKSDNTKEDVTALFNEAKVYLSTTKTWLKVKPKVSLVTDDKEDIYCYNYKGEKQPQSNKGSTPTSKKGSSSKKIKLCIKLLDTDPAIVAFKKNPDGYTTNWPLLKIELQKFQNLSDPYFIRNLKVKTTVTGFKQFELYNNQGKISTKKPFPLLGVTPDQHSNFFIGSNELFSKPIDHLNLNLEWNILPKGRCFNSYYSEYNAYLDTYESELEELLMEEQVAKKNKEPSKHPNLFKKLQNKIAALIKKVKDESEEEKLGYYNNLTFRVDFENLDNNKWSAIDFEQTVKNKKDSPFNYPEYALTDQCKVKFETIDTSKLYLFASQNVSVDSKSGATTKCLLSDSSNYTYSKKKESKGKSYTLPDSSIQLAPLTFTDKTANGFVKMELTMPTYGFGKDLYPKVIVHTALVNANQVLQPPSGATFKMTPNVPFTPTVKTFVGAYEASICYDLTSTGEYPIECYTYTPFETVKIYDNTYKHKDIKNLVSYELNRTSSKEVTLTNPIENTSEETTTLKGVPIHFPFYGKGSLLLEMNGVEGNQELNLYFQLAPKIGKLTEPKPISYSCLQTNNWKEATLLADQTNGFKCSGIISLTVPEKVATDNVFMPSKQAWVSITVNNTPSIFSGTLYLNTNGIELERAGTNYLNDDTAPEIPADTISGLKNRVKGVTGVLQPFSSYGGKKEESAADLTQRTSQRIATKGRTVSAGNYYQLIQNQFSKIYYSSAFYDKKLNTTAIFLVRKVASETDAQAFLPLVTECCELNVLNYLTERSSALANITVNNFHYEYVSVNADVELQEGVAEGFKTQLSEYIDVYLSPWIESTQEQLTIHQEIKETELVNFILSYEEVISVSALTFKIYEKVYSPNTQEGEFKTKTDIKLNPKVLYVSYRKHNLSKKTTS